jgi:hypothetical protein
MQRISDNSNINVHKAQLIRCWFFALKASKANTTDIPERKAIAHERFVSAIIVIIQRFFFLYCDFEWLFVD